MIERGLEAELHRHFHDRLDGERAPTSLATRVVEVPAVEVNDSRIGRATRLSRTTLMAAAVVLLAMALIGMWAVGSALTREDPVRATRACDLLTATFLAEQFDSTIETRGGDESRIWWPYSRDWFVPGEAQGVLGPTTSDCAFVNESRQGPLGHVELFVRNRPTSQAEAAALVADLFRDPMTTTDVGGRPRWRTEFVGGQHAATAFVEAEFLVVISISAEAEIDRALDVIAAEVIRNMERERR